MSSIEGLNHVTFAVSELDLSYAFYTDVLGFAPRARWAKGAYLSAGELWLCLSVDEVRAAADYSHVALTINADDYQFWSQRLTDAGVRQWKENTSEGDSIYFLDPDGHKLELHVGDLASRLVAIHDQPYDGMEFFDVPENSEW